MTQHETVAQAVVNYLCDELGFRNGDGVEDFGDSVDAESFDEALEECLTSVVDTSKLSDDAFAEYKAAALVAARRAFSYVGEE